MDQQKTCIESRCSCRDRNSGPVQTVQERNENIKDALRLGGAAAVFAAGLFISESAAVGPFAIKAVLFMISYLAAGYPVLWGALKHLWKRQPFDETLLMSVATLGAAALGDFAEAAAVMLLFGLGEFLQDIAQGSAQRGISALLELNPGAAHRLKGGAVETVHPAEVAVGEMIWIKPHERCPLDVEVTDGDSFVNLSALTGESRPVAASAGKRLPAGAMNGDGALTARVTAVSADSAISRLIKMTTEAAQKKAPRERLITRLARIYTPVAVAIAALVAIVPPFLLNLGDFRDWLHTALTLLVIACPCALVISVPLTFFAGLGGVSRRGILIRGSESLEALARAKAAALDKTGTLTKGEFAVLDVKPAPGVDAGQLLEWAAHAESLSTHPIGRSIVSGYGQEIDITRISGITEEKGLGVLATVDGRKIVCGKPQILARQDIEVPEQDKTAGAVYVAVDGQYLGAITLGDCLKPDAAETIAALKKLGLRTVMLTGDSKQAAQPVADALGLDEYFAELLPEDKVAHITRLKAETAGPVAFVGDGINDAPVIAAADVGISMGELGSDAAIEASDIVIMTDEPAKLAEGIRASRKTLRIVSQNIGLALGVKCAVLALGLFGISSMWMAVVADVGVALIAVANAMRAFRIPKKRTECESYDRAR